MLSRTLKILKIGGLVLGASLVTLLAVRAYDVCALAAGLAFLMGRK